MCQHCNDGDHDEDQDALAAEFMRRQAAKLSLSAGAGARPGTMQAGHALFYRKASPAVPPRDENQEPTC